jgi:uncharacterized membrane protein YbhN (UPF0104 family)
VSKKLRLLVSIALLSWLAWRMDWAQIAQAFVQLRLGLWVGAVGLYLVIQAVSALRWQLLARPLGFHEPLARFFGYYFIGMFFNLLLPTSVGGDVIRAWYLDARPGRRLPAFASVFADRFSGLLVLLAMACVAAVLCPIDLPPRITISVWATAGCAVLGLAALPILSRYTERVDRVCRLVGGLRVYLAEPRLLLTSTALSLAVQAGNVLVAWLVGLAIAAPVPASYYWILVPMVTLLTLLPVSLNGMGIREGGMILFLAPLGVADATAVSLAFLWFLVFTTASLLGAGCYLFGNFSRPEGQPDHEFIRGDSDQGRARQSKTAA